jgi:hypothetical protein
MADQGQAATRIRIGKKSKQNKKQKNKSIQGRHMQITEINEQNR